MSEKHSHTNIWVHIVLIMCLLTLAIFTLSSRISGLQDRVNVLEQKQK